MLSYTRSIAASVLLLGLALPAAAERIVAEIDRAYPPHQFADAKGRPAGFDVELLRAVAEEAGLELELRLGPWPEILPRLESGRIDVSPGLYRTPAREQRLDFTVPIAHTHHAIFVRLGSGIETRADLAGRRVLVNRSGYHEERIREENLPVEAIPAEGPEDMMLRLARGEADAAVVLNTQGLYFIRQHDLRDVRSLAEPLAEMKLRMAVPQGREDLLVALNDGLLRVRETGRYDALYDRWFGVLHPEGVPAGRVLMLLGASLLALLVVGGGSALWSRALQRQVRERTRELLESDARLAATLAAARDVGFVEVEAPGDDARILEFSEGAERLFGYARDEVIGRPAGMLRSRADALAHGGALGPMDAEGRRSREAELLRKTDESFPALVVAARLPGDGERPARLLYVVIDLTERTRAEEAQLLLREQLHRADKMEALGRMAGGVAHDFNNVLTSMLGGAALLRRDLAGHEAATRRCDDLIASARTAADLVRQLLDFARRTPGAAKVTTWNDVIGEIEPLLARLLPAGVHLEVRLASEPWPIHIDPVQAQQVVMNLVLNARDAIEGSGRIELCSESRLRDGRPVAVLAVRDDGVGMDEETRERLFEPFYTTKGDRGTGLGLATVYAAVTGAGGDIHVESAPGRGTTVRVVLQRYADSGGG
jgi:two-component system sensor histidine kinase EvgS